MKKDKIVKSSKQLTSENPNTNSFQIKNSTPKLNTNNDLMLIKNSTISHINYLYCHIIIFYYDFIY